MFSKLINDILPKSGAFLAVFFVVMVIGYGFLYLVDFVPEPVTTEDQAILSATTTNEVLEPIEEEVPVIDSNADPLPVSITFDSLDRTVTVLNPSSRAIADLDNALLKGVVRHPDSDDFTGPGNILILGHSSYLKNVFNKNYQAFNHIQDLTFGDTIRLKSGDTEYIYKVDRVYKAEASDVNVETGGDEYRLTLVTCNVLGAKEDRYILEATLVSKKAL